MGKWCGTMNKTLALSVKLIYTLFIFRTNCFLIVPRPSEGFWEPPPIKLFMSVLIGFGKLAGRIFSIDGGQANTDMVVECVPCIT